MLTQRVNYYVTSCKVKRHGHRQLNTESKITNNARRPRLVERPCSCWQAFVLRLNKAQYRVCDKLSGQYSHISCLETVIN